MNALYVTAIFFIIKLFWDKKDKIYEKLTD